jgi:SAM-dependent methyltransferase
MVRDDYEVWAATYDAVDNPLVAMSTFAVEQASWNGLRVLELGCGTARNAGPILAAGARQYVGVDASQRMLARARVQDARVRLMVGDVSDAPRDAFDVAVFCLVLEHFEAVEAPLASAAMALRPGGELRIFELHPAWWHDGGRAHYVVDGEERAVASWAHDEAEFVKVMPAVGLEIVSVRSWYGNEAACSRSAKLRKRMGKPVLLELIARQAGGTAANK